MIVIDASVIIDAFALPASIELKDQILALGGSGVFAPHLIDLEVLHVLKKFVSGGGVTPSRAQIVLDALRELRIARVPHFEMASRIWELRHNFTAYDGAYVALAELLGARLLTRDLRLAAAVSAFTMVDLV